MLPIQLITGLFTATIVGATAKFVNQPEFSLIGWFMYVYLIGYRIKVFLDDLVYYQKMKTYALGGGDPILGLITWILWISTAIVLGNEKAYFGLTSLTFGLGVIWVSIAKRNVPKKERGQPANIIKQIKSAHKRWWWFNFIPFISAGVYFILYVVGKPPSWSTAWYWIGPTIMIIGLIWDIATDYEFMFQLNMKVENTI